jgi:glycyl-tRNA synthetase alpha subunit
MYAMTTFQL